MQAYYAVKHNRSLKVAVQGLDYYGPPLKHSFIYFTVVVRRFIGVIPKRVSCVEDIG
jgi:hypothetical protein